MAQVFVTWTVQIHSEPTIVLYLFAIRDHLKGPLRTGLILYIHVFRIFNVVLDIMLWVYVNYEVWYYTGDEIRQFMTYIFSGPVYTMKSW